MRRPGYFLYLSEPLRPHVRGTPLCLALLCLWLAGGAGPRAGESGIDRSPAALRHELQSLVWLECLTPEAAAVYAADPSARAKVAQLVAEVEEMQPFWWMNGLNLGGAGGEGSFQPPQFAIQVFLAKAWILKEPHARLTERLPWPNVYATLPRYRDLFYLQHLAVCLQTANRKGGNE